MNELLKVFIKEKEAKDALSDMQKEHGKYFCPRLRNYCKPVCVALSSEVFILDDSFDIDSGSEVEQQIEKLLDEHGDDSILFCASVMCTDFSITGGY